MLAAMLARTLANATVPNTNALRRLDHSLGSSSTGSCPRAQLAIGSQVSPHMFDIDDAGLPSDWARLVVVLVRARRSVLGLDRR